jgi:hypothetical protein
VSKITFDSNKAVSIFARLVFFSEVGMISKLERHYWHVATPTEWQDSESPYELVTVCFWSIALVALTALLIWLALGGQF